MIEEPDTTAPGEEAAPADAEATDARTESPAAPAEAPLSTDPKERRRQTRSRSAGEARPSRSPEERAAERLERRRVRAAARRRWRARQREKRGDAGPAKAPTPPAPGQGRGRPRVRQGIVVSDRADKTITVRIDVARQHRTYKKIVRSSSTLHAHDEQNDAGAGDTVRVVESRPLSRTKRWRLVEIMERAR